MTDRLRISGTPVITEDESTGEITVDVDATNTERQSLTDEVIRVYGQPDGGTYEDYPLADYASFEAAIQQANDDLAAHLGTNDVGVIELPKGDFTHTGNTVQLDGAAIVRGQGMLSTRVTLADSANADMFEWSPDSGIENFVSFEYMYLDGNIANNTSGRAIYITDADGGTPKDAKLQDLWLNNFAGNGFEFDISSPAGAKGHHLSRIFSENHGGAGGVIGGNWVYAEDLFMSQNTGDGLEARELRNSNVSAVCDGNDTVGATLYDARKCHLEITAGSNQNQGILTDGSAGTDQVRSNIVMSHHLSGNNLSAGAFDDLEIGAGTFDNHFWITDKDGTVDASSGSDNYYWGKFDTGNSSFGSTSRNVINGVSDNGANDPASAGVWNGNQLPGIAVKWDDGAGNDFMSWYDPHDGQWWDASLA